jgi:hypothetical protein
MTGKITYLERHDIDDEKWNVCIDRAGNGVIYGYSFYLDHMATQWSGLVWNDYEAVMPLPWRQKWGVFYLYQPFLTAQLGVFGNKLSKELFINFLSAIPGKFRYWDISLNHHNHFDAPGFPVFDRSNYILDLNRPYADIFNGYRQNIKRNIKKATNYGCSVEKDLPVIDIINLAGINSNHERSDFEKFERLFNFLKSKNQTTTYGVFSLKELIASSVLFFSHKRIYYILVGNHPNGRTLGASHLLVDAFIRDYAGKELILDFEGSDIPNLAFFYSGFGAVEEKYAALRLNRLPWYAKWLKK